MLGDELMSAVEIGLGPEDQEGVDLAFQVLRTFDLSTISADELAKDTYLGEEGVAQRLSSDGVER